MIIQALVEDKSGAVIIESVLQHVVHLLPAIPIRYGVYGHRGCGALPKDWRQMPHIKDQSLLALLPAKLRAYQTVFETTCDEPLIVMVVMDSDEHPPKPLFHQLKQVSHVMSPTLPVVIGLAVEELEAWLLGDQAAVLQAYPDADRDFLDGYEQDSVCGTWEVLCRAILGAEKAEALIQIGYPAIGKYKYQWASAIAPLMLPDRNVSPSFQQFYRALVQTIAESIQTMAQSNV